MNDSNGATQTHGWPSAAWQAAAPGRDGFVALLAAFRPSGGTAPDEVLGGLMQERSAGGAAGLARLIASGQVFGFGWRASLWLPMFQFDADDLSPRPGPQRVRALLPAWQSGWATACWFAAPNRWLAGACPADGMATAADAVLQAARRLKSAAGCGNAPKARATRRHTEPCPHPTSPADPAQEN